MARANENVCNLRHELVRLTGLRVVRELRGGSVVRGGGGRGRGGLLLREQGLAGRAPYSSPGVGVFTSPFFVGAVLAGHIFAPPSPSPPPPPPSHALFIPLTKPVCVTFAVARNSLMMSTHAPAAPSVAVARRTMSDLIPCCFPFLPRFRPSEATSWRGSRRCRGKG